MLAAVVLAAVIVLPGFVLLYVLDQRGLLPEEGVDDVADPALAQTRWISAPGNWPPMHTM